MAMNSRAARGSWQSVWLICALTIGAVVGITSLWPSDRPDEDGPVANAALQASATSDSAASEVIVITRERRTGAPATAVDPVIRAEESLRFERVRKGIQAGDSSVLQDAKRYAVLGSLCAQYASMLNHAARDNESYRFARNFLAERCAGLDLSIRISSGELVSLGDPILRAEDFVRQFDPDFSSAESLANAEFPTPDEWEPRSNALIDLILKADYWPTLSEALLAFAVDDDRQAHPRMRLPFVEGLPRMGNFYDYRSNWFLGLVAIQVGCLDRVVDCGPNSLFVIRLCMYKDTCRNGITVEDYIFDNYSGRQIMASRIAAQRIVSARADRNRGKP